MLVLGSNGPRHLDLTSRMRSLKNQQWTDWLSSGMTRSVLHGVSVVGEVIVVPPTAMLLGLQDVAENMVPDIQNLLLRNNQQPSSQESAHKPQLASPLCC